MPQRLDEGGATFPGFPIKSARRWTGSAITPRAWWLGVAIVTAAILAHALLPRYEWHASKSSRVDLWIKYDRWTGTSSVEVLPAPPARNITY